jgi:chemotaxis protein CheX
MHVTETDLVQMMREIWTSLLGLEVEPAGEADRLGPLSLLTGCIQITGAWEGAVTLHCCTELARTAAATMFSLEPHAITVAEMQDALGELVNMLGGGVKALLPEIACLSLPTVVEGSDYNFRVPGSSPLCRVTLRCQELPLLVTLLQKNVR